MFLLKRKSDGLYVEFDKSFTKNPNLAKHFMDKYFIDEFFNKNTHLNVEDFEIVDSSTIEYLYWQ